MTRAVSVSILAVFASKRYYIAINGSIP